MKLPLKGIIPPMITPLLENKELDSIGLKNIIEHLIDGGVHGIFLLGTNGEGPSLSYCLRKQLITEACEIIDGRVSVLVGITDTSFDDTLDIANYAKGAGADVLVVAPPYYFPISEGEMKEYLTALAPLLPLPFLLYNIPSCTKLHLGVEIVKKARELGAIGVKDSSGDMESFYEILEAFKDEPDFSVILGNETYLTEAFAKGAHGAVAGGANISPSLFVNLYQACIQEDQQSIKELRKQVLTIDETIYNVNSTPTSSIKAIKSALAIMGVCDDNMAQPLKKLKKEQRDKVKESLLKFNLIT